MSKLLEGSMGASTVVGTLENCAPEVVSSENYSFPVDMWSLGTVLYQMMVGRTPFTNERGLNLVKLAQGTYEPISATLGYSQPLVDLVGLCLSVDPSRRPTPAQVLALPFVAIAREAAARSAAEARTAALEVHVGRLLQEVGALQTANVERLRANEELQREVGTLRREISALQRANEEHMRTNELQRRTNQEQCKINEKLQKEMEVLQATRNEANDVSSYSLRPNSLGECAITHTPTGDICVFTYPDRGGSVCGRTVFLERRITEGVYKWNLKVDFGISCNFYIGCALADSVKQWDERSCNYMLGNCSNSCSVEIYGSRDMKCLLHGVKNSSGQSIKLSSNSLVSAEVDVGARTLSFFFDDGTKGPCVISNIPVPLHFGFSKSYNTKSFTSLALLRLATPTPSAVRCTYFECCK